jgi:N-methylhydantoinase A
MAELEFGFGTAHGSMSRAVRCGVDTGGTFTDIVVEDSAGQIHVLKTSSTPDDPSVAVLTGLGQMRDQGTDLRSVQFFAHGTTVGTNALLEGKTPDVTLVVTKGMRAIAEVGDQTRGYGSKGVFDLNFSRPRPLAPPAHIREVGERIDAHGEVIQPLDQGEVDALAAELEIEAPAAVAICLLFSFLAQEHEQRVGDALRRRLSSAHVAESSSVLPTIREHLRLSTTVVNAALSPVLHDYLDNLEQGLRTSFGITTRDLFAFQSNGGMGDFGYIRQLPVSTALSGPAAGVIGAAKACAALGSKDIVSFDMGGTSCDVALVQGGHPSERAETTIAGHQIGLSALDVETISAGGGTIVWVDAVGNLQLGPHSAGADPGPAAYARGGTRPTVTDADLVLGLIGTHGGGAPVELDDGAAADCLRRSVADPLGLGLVATAWGVYRLINGRMADAIRLVSTNRGVDLTSFALCAFGGAGPVHAAAVAELVGMRTVIVPKNAPVMAAMGLLMADIRHDFVLSRPAEIGEPAATSVVAEVFDELDRRADAEFGARENAEQYRRDRFVDMRYRGQGYELTVPLQVDGAGWIDLQHTRQRFEQMHRTRYGHDAPERAVEIVTYRLTISRSADTNWLEQGLPNSARRVQLVDPVRRHVRWMGEERQTWPVARRQDLEADTCITGPLIVEEPGTSVVVPPGWDLICRRSGHLVLQRTGDADAC